MAISDEDSCSCLCSPPNSFFGGVFGTMVAEANLSLWQLWSLSLSLVCLVRGNKAQFAFLRVKGWGRQWESPEEQRRAWTHPLTLHCLVAGIQALYDPHLLLLHAFCQGSCVCAGFSSGEDLDQEQGLFQSHIYPQLWDPVYLETEKKQFWLHCFWGAI